MKANVDSVFELEYDSVTPLIKMLYAFCYLADTVRCVTDNAFCQNYRLYLTLAGLVDQQQQKNTTKSRIIRELHRLSREQSDISIPLSFFHLILNVMLPAMGQMNPE